MGKCNKSLTAKEQVSTKGLSVREMEHHMDIDMFLDVYAGWEVGSPHSPINLHEMFQYATEQGWKEAGGMVCQGHWHSLPKLDPQADVSVIWLVGPQTSKEEFRALYYEVYKLRRLPASPLWGLQWMEELATEMVSFLKDCLGQKKGKSPQGIEEPGPADIWPPRSKPLGGRGGTFLLRGTLLRWGKPIRGPWPLQQPWRSK